MGIIVGYGGQGYLLSTRGLGITVARGSPLAFDRVEERGCHSIYAATMVDDSTCHYDVDWTKSPVALVKTTGDGLFVVAPSRRNVIGQCPPCERC